MSAPLQYGQQVRVGLDGYESDGTIADSADNEHAIDETVILDKNNTPTTHMFHGKYRVITITGVILAAGFTEPEPGTLAQINGGNAPILSCALKPDRLAHKVTLRVKAFDDITYT